MNKKLEKQKELSDAEIINTILKNLSITQKELGDKIGLSSSAITAIKKGYNSLNSRNKKLLSSEFNISLDWLETGSGEMFSDKSDFNYIKKIIDIISQKDKKSSLLKKVVDIDENEIDDIAIISKKNLIFH
ncbi:helix-turn-helix domain-containing protein [Clostridium sp.]|uniref:helix-turn-helix domain-containing protein n=1 Tax=Clostridium sp. TaxID=1506 RepID=UPI003992FE18